MNNPELHSPPPASENQDDASPVVLVIDDEQGLRDMLAFGLKKRGYQTHVACDGQQALALIEQHEFDLAVCDIMMPGIGGIEVLKCLKERQPNIEVIMATGYATLETAVEAMKIGAFDYISKPYSLVHLCAIFDKALERQRMKAKIGHLEELNRLKNEFMATMSHELRTPMASVLGYASLLEQHVYGDLTEAQEKAIHRIEINAHNLLQLINSILDLSKLNAHRMTLTPEPFVLNDLVDEVVSTMDSLAQAKHLAIAVEASQQCQVVADKTKLKQVLINLCGNAIKFTKTGKVTVILQAEADPRWVRIIVQDTGIGIAEKDITELFQEFKQLDGTVTREYGGTGLGLAICKKMMALMDGTIEVESELNVGSRFIVRAPLMRLSESTPTAVNSMADALPEGGDKKIVLAIDDDADVLQVLADSLKDFGCRVVGAQSGEEGLALARELKPYCITLDIMMPHMDGWSVLQKIKLDPELKTIPVYIVSIVDNRPLAFSMGVAGYIVKPFDRQQLLSQLALVPKRSLQQVLIVDDDPAVRDTLIEKLTEEGYDVQAVDSGEKAMDLLRHIQPDILFLDLVMHNMSGFEVLDAIEKDERRPNMPIIVMTEKELTDEEHRWLERRVDMVLSKNATKLEEMIMITKTTLAQSKRVA